MLKLIDQDKAKQWLESHWNGNKTCPICASNNWALGEKVVELREQAIEQLESFKVYPVLVVTCKTCGNTLLFNLVVSGLVSPDPEPPKSSEGKSVEATPVTPVAKNV